MKKYIKSSEYICAMSIINPKYCSNHTIQVEIEQRDERSIPHLHVYHDHTRNPKKCSYVRLDKVSYSDHHGKPSIELPSNLKQQFVELMNKPWPKHLIELSDGTIRPATGYEAAVDIWVDTYEQDLSKFHTDEKGNLIQLDYSSL